MASQGGGHQESNTAPWKPQGQILKNTVFPEALRLYNSPFQYYSGNTIAGFTPYQRQAQQMVANRAMNGSDLERNAQTQTLATARGDYLDPAKNPWLTGAYNQAYNDARPNLNAAAVQSGMIGSTGSQVADSVLRSRLANDIYGGNYQFERGNQMAAIAASPGMANIDYQNAGRLAAVGEEQQNMNQALTNEDIARQQFNQIEPWQRLNLLGQMIQGDYGGSVDGSGRQSSFGKG